MLLFGLRARHIHLSSKAGTKVDNRAYIYLAETTATRSV